MDDLFTPFLTGTGPLAPLPLRRFLPPLPAGMVSAWLKANVAPGGLVIDPLSAGPTLALEAARAGYRVLVVSNNPILSFILEVLASAPSVADFQSALAELASFRRGEERLELHLQSIYQTTCPNCAQKIPAQAFLWRKTEKQPYARLIHCPHCSQQGEYPLLPDDIERLNPPGNPGLHRARALERVSLPDDPGREGVEEALQVYLPRAIYFIFTLINRLEGPNLPPEKRRLLTALALSMFDEANSLWQHPSGRSRPRQLSFPTQFRENNLWLALESALTSWCGQPGPVPLKEFKGQPPLPGEIALFHGRLRSLVLPPELPIAAAVALLPRPNQAFWTLSAIWAGWLWGREAVQPLHSALERRRYDWHWHTSALHQVLSAFARLSPPETPLFTLMPELVPGFFSAAVIAARSAGLELKSLALHAGEEYVQASWRVKPASRPAAPDEFWDKIALAGIQQELVRRAEPARYLPLHTAAVASLAVEPALPAAEPQVTPETLNHLQAVISRVLTSSPALIRYEARPQNVESGLWWLADPPPALPLPLADRLEMEVVRFLQRNPGHTQAELEVVLASLFPGLLTPESDLVRICLESYGDRSSSLPEHWQLAQTEQPSVRRHDLEIIRRGLETLAQSMGFIPSGENPVHWSQAGTGPGYNFYLLASGYISRYLLAPPILPPSHCILVLPGGRANLVAYKLHRDPRLAEILGSGWRFLKFRLLRTLLDRSALSITQFDELLASDPPRWESSATQLSMFPDLE